MWVVTLSATASPAAARPEADGGTDSSAPTLATSSSALRAAASEVVAAVRQANTTV